MSKDNRKKRREKKNIKKDKKEDIKLVGTLRKKSRNYGFLMSMNIEEEAKLDEYLEKKNYSKYKYKRVEEDIYISGQNIKNANDGDIITAKNLTESSVTGGNQEAEVEEILIRNNKLVVGTLSKQKKFSFVVPDDKTFMSDIFISQQYDCNAKTDDKVVVEITKYSRGKENSEGRVVKVLGNKNDPETLVLSILEDRGIEVEFSEKVVKSLDKIPDSLSEEQITYELEEKEREDLRELTGKDGKKIRVYTIDGEDAKDLDDAVAIEKQGGKYRVWIHIADVSEYVQENTALDFEAFQRSNSIYLIDTVVPMLPKKLSNGICSLNVGEDRLAFTVSADINTKGEILSFKVYTSIINVDKRLNYNLVQEIIDGKNEYEHNNLNIEIDYIDKMNLMNFKELAEILIEKRIQNGYVNFEMPETKIILDDEKRVKEICREEEIFSERIIEQLMITANEIIGRICIDHNISAVYRVHEEPNIDKVKEINEILKITDVRVSISKRKDENGKTEEYVESSEYTRVLNQIKDKLKLTEKDYWKKNGNEEMQEKSEVIYRFLQYMLLRTMMVAKYNEKPIGHFGLGSENYLHFTAPIRRYADLFVHRNLKKYIRDKGASAKSGKQEDFEKAELVAKKISDKERKTTEIEREYIKYKEAEYMQRFIGDMFTGVITSVTNYGMYVELINTIEGYVRFENMKDIYTKADEGYATGKKHGKRFSIGDSVKVLVTNVNLDTAEIDFHIVNELNKNE